MISHPRSQAHARLQVWSIFGSEPEATESAGGNGRNAAGVSVRATLGGGDGSGATPLLDACPLRVRSYLAIVFGLRSGASHTESAAFCEVRFAAEVTAAALLEPCPAHSPPLVSSMSMHHYAHHRVHTTPCASRCTPPCTGTQWQSLD